jgi:hypothetical protein
VTAARSRLIVKVLFRAPRLVGLRQLVRWLAAPLDLVMMRKQLLTLGALAEDDWRRRSRSAMRRA